MSKVSPLDDFEEETQKIKKEKKFRRLSMFWKVFIALLTIAIVATIGGVTGYYISITDQTVKENSTTPPRATSPSSSTSSTTSNAPNDVYYVGVAREDVTGPIVQVNMMGYAHPEQVANGLHTRLYSRAYVVADEKQENRVAFVSFDGGMGSQLIKLEIVKRLQEKHGDLFTEKNVVISGTHTHSGPAGFFQYLLFEVTSLGHINQTTETFINGIVNSIETANANLEKATIKMGKSNVDTGNINRSPTSYLRNPAEEREKYSHDTEQEITVIRFDTVGGEPMGMISWYPVHPTSVNYSNLLINSDNKGRASMLFEERMRKDGESQTGKERFVAAFAQANLGDVSPRTNGPICIDSGEECEPYSSTCNNRSQNCIGFGPGENHFESADIIARRQLEAAWDAYNNASDIIEGPISWVHQYVDMSDTEVTLPDSSTVSSCKPGMGYSFASGCTDGAGAFDFVQGMTDGTTFWDAISRVICTIVCTESPPRAYQRCHEPKPILFPTGYMDLPYEWHPTIVDVQLLRIGQLLIPAVPGEYTTMAGRRFKVGLVNKALDSGMPDNLHVVIAGLSNVYTHYISTPEEYEAQRYEAASVIFGINTLAIYQVKFENLLEAMIKGEQDNVEPGPLPTISPADQGRLVAVPGPDETGEGLDFGDVIEDVQSSYSPGSVVSVMFEGANPRHNMKLGSTYLEVQRQVGSEDNWTTAYTDADWSTKFTWIQSNDNESRDDVNIFTALFDIIAAETNLRFDIYQAIELYEKEDWTQNVFTEDLLSLGEKEKKERVIKKLLDLKLLSKRGKKDTRRETKGESNVIIDWEVPLNETNGVYRIMYYGDRMTANGSIVPFTGSSSTFLIEN